MPIHNWKRVKAGIFHAFHHDWITEIARALNRGILPPTYYALPEQHAAGFGPDVLTLQEENATNNATDDSPAGGVLLAAPKLKPIAETEMDFYRRKQMNIAVRHVSDDRLAAMIEIVSPGNKSGRKAVQSFVDKAAELLDKQIHLLIVDLHPPGKRDPNGIHGEIWEAIAGEEYEAPTAKPFTLASYESQLTVKAYVVHAAVGDDLSDMPLFLEAGKAIEVPLEATYRAAFADVPRRWRTVLEP